VAYAGSEVMPGLPVIALSDRPFGAFNPA